MEGRLPPALVACRHAVTCLSNPESKISCKTACVYGWDESNDFRMLVRDSGDKIEARTTPTEEELDASVFCRLAELLVSMSADRVDCLFQWLRAQFLGAGRPREGPANHTATIPPAGADWRC